MLVAIHLHSLWLGRGFSKFVPSQIQTRFTAAAVNWGARLDVIVTFGQRVIAYSVEDGETRT